MGLEAGVGHIVIDNRLEIERLAELTAGRPARQPVLVRVAPGIDPHTHRRISTGQVDTKFGFDIQSGAALQAVTDVCNLPGLEFRGLHCHVGSQLHDTDCHRSSVGIMVDLMAEIRGELGVTVEELNIGGGLGIRYLSSHRPPTLDEFADAVTGAVREKLDEHALPAPILLQEPGRFLVGEAGTTLYTLGAIKEVPGIRTYVSVDGGLSDNPRPALYDAKYEAILANRASEPHDRPYTVAGKHCETDVLFWDLPLPEVRSGDVLAVQSTGAYNFVMASNYNRFLRPGVVLVADGRADLAVRRETYEDLLRTDVMPERLA